MFPSCELLLHSVYQLYVNFLKKIPQNVYLYTIDCFNLPREEQVLKGIASGSSFPHALLERPLQVLTFLMHPETYN